MAGRSASGSSTSRHRTARRRRMTASPSAARTFRTHWHRSPSIGTRYQRPSQSAIPSGKRRIRPDRRPVTSSVTQRLGRIPQSNTRAQQRENHRAVALPCPPAYMARRRSSEMSMMPSSVSSPVPAAPRAWRDFTAVFGYRLRPGSGVTFESLATLLSATMHGLIIAALSAPEVVSHRVRARPFGAVDEQDWSLPALGLGSFAAAFLEPDPDVEWDEHRLARIHEILRTWVPDDT